MHHVIHLIEKVDHKTKVIVDIVKLLLNLFLIIILTLKLIILLEMLGGY